MNLYGNFKSPLGYQTGESQIDTYGVDHSGFSTRDELEYQFARQNKENQLIQNYNNQGITKNYPQYTTNFWGVSSNDNYGFGSSNIHDNIENRNNNPFENTVNTFGQNQTEQSYELGSENQTFGQENNNSTQWGLNNNPLEQNNNNNTLSGNLFGNNNLFNQNQSVWNKNQYQTQTPSRYNLKDLTDRLQQYQNNALGNSNSTLNSGLNNGSIFSPNNMQSLNLNASSALYPQQNSFNSYSQPYQLAQNTNPNMASDVASNNIDYSLYGNGFTKEFINEMVNNKEYQRALQEYAIPNEGGYVNDPQDPGGETKFGISKRYHPNEDIKNLTRERANALLFKEIWNWNGINTLPSEIRGFVFDHGIRTSPQNAIETPHKPLDIEPVGDVTKKTTLNQFENIKRELQQDALDVAYGASRTINGMTAGGWDYLGDKLGFDSRMNGYLDNLPESERVQRKALADVLEFGGAALPVGIAINAGVRALRVPYNAWQIGRAYDKLRKDPFIGNGKDVIAKMKDHNGENVLLQRGEVIRGRDGNIKASGNDLLRETGTKRNFGLNKAIYKHNITKDQATKIPRYIRGNPVETNQYGQSVYEIKRPDGNFRIVTSSKDADKILSSMYKIER